MIIKKKTLFKFLSIAQYGIKIQTRKNIVFYHIICVRAKKNLICGIDTFKSEKYPFTSISTTNTPFIRLQLLDKFKAITKITDVIHALVTMNIYKYSSPYCYPCLLNRSQLVA